MRAVISRVTRASVTVEDRLVSEIGSGLLVLLGVAPSDGDKEIELTARKIADQRIFGDRSAAETGKPVLLVSQFTLYGDIRKGRRPSWSHAAPGDVAEEIYERVATELRQAHGLTVETGEFGAMMAVESVNDGPFTLWWEC
ncbi:D-aminoacyl-tRNA deacylase [Flaviflexus massiliensis]|uniref:D-aminoacyl-tRNA deacylase n=1 Tax=Flaviflexus massiliensis TaxID=1522309 RepID=UPI0006D57D1B|nr:D-aminoacyl-tRNA deacylase [Flaviflexus massiliensis]